MIVSIVDITFTRSVEFAIVMLADIEKAFCK